MLRLLLTNDDGIQAPGLRELAAQLAVSAQVTVVAPERPSSAMSQSITLHKPLRVRQSPEFAVACGNAPLLQAYTCSGTPADCVIVALHHLCKERWPDIVLSGINDGCNVAQDLVYSGTVGAALEGSVNGIPSIAISLAGTEHSSFAEAAQIVDLLLSLLVFGSIEERQCLLATHLLADQVQRHGQLDQAALHMWGRPVAVEETGSRQSWPDPGTWLPAGLRGTPCFNVNIPDVALAGLQGVCWTLAGHREYRNIVQQVIDPRGEPYYWVAGERDHSGDLAGTDTFAIEHALVSVTPVSYDLSNESYLAHLLEWFRERTSRSMSQE